MMNGKPAWIRHLVGYSATLVVGLVGMTATHPVQARPVPGKTSFLQLAQSSRAIAGTWRLISMGSPDSPTLVPRTPEVTADFTRDRVSGSGGCNRYFGDIKTTNAKLSIGPLGSTQMACEGKVMDLEMKYLKALQGAQRYEFNRRGELEISYQTDQESGILRFTSTAIPALW